MPSYYAYWNSKFLAFSNNNKELSQDLLIRKFLNHLRAEKDIADWQIQ